MNVGKLVQWIGQKMIPYQMAFDCSNFFPEYVCIFAPHTRPTICGGIDAMETQFFNKCHSFDVKTGEWHEFHSLLEPRLVPNADQSWVVHDMKVPLSD